MKTKSAATSQFPDTTHGQTSQYQSQITSAETKLDDLSEIFLDKEHDFVLYRGGALFGRKSRMTGFEAEEANQKLEEQFRNSKRPDAKLWAWKLGGSKSAAA